MRKLILKMHVSIDGFAGGPNGESGWIFPSMDEGTTAWTLDTLWQAGVHIMGRRTFYDMACYWPYTMDPFAAPMNEIPKVVFSKKGLLEPVSEKLTTRGFKDAPPLQQPEGSEYLSPHAATWAEVTVLTGDLATEITRMKQQPGKDILAHGGAGFVQSLVRTGLIDEYRLLTHPVALGAGLPVFYALSKPIDLKLVSITPFPSGAAAHIYRPACLPDAADYPNPPPIITR